MKILVVAGLGDDLPVIAVIPSSELHGYDIEEMNGIVINYTCHSERIGRMVELLYARLGLSPRKDIVPDLQRYIVTHGNVYAHVVCRIGWQIV